MTDTEQLRQRLLDRIDSRKALIAIVGMGYVGLPLMLAATRAGFSVLGFDIDAPKVENLNKGISPLHHVGDEHVAKAAASGRFEATADAARLGEADAILICVPTPIGKHREPDLSYVEGTALAIVPHLDEGRLVVLESTTWPGTTRELLRPILERDGLVSEENLFLAYSPEREDPGNTDFNTSRIPKVIGGDGPHSLEIASRLYAAIVEKIVPVSSTATAEAVKLTENIFRAVNIALVNELKLAYEPMGIDIFEVIEAAKTKPFGFMPFYPGPGLGGHCIPIDPFYLTWKAREHGVSTRFIELAGEINTAMPHHVVARTAEALDRRRNKGLNGSRIMVLGVAYKKNVDDVRESPALTILDLLVERGAQTLFHDPFVASIPRTREHPMQEGRKSSPLDDETLAQLDAIILVTDHDNIDHAAIADRVPVLVDTRGRLDPRHPNVFRA
ncbi:MAG: nucleotide sugar dehydrogenase [Geminicoccaceae bacterium]